MRLRSRSAALLLFFALAFSGARLATPQPPAAVTPPEAGPSEAGIVAAGNSAELPFLGASSVVLELAATSTLRPVRHVDRTARHHSADTDSSQPATTAGTRARLAGLTYLSYAAALVSIKTGALSARGTSTPPPTA